MNRFSEKVYEATKCLIPLTALILAVSEAACKNPSGQSPTSGRGSTTAPTIIAEKRQDALALRSSPVPPLLDDWSVVQPSAILLPVNYFKVVIQRGVDHVRTTGAPTMAGEPDDYDDTYLARRDVDERSLPASLRELRGKPVTIFYQDGSTCTTELGSIAAYGWLKSPLGMRIDRGVPERQRNRMIAERTMARGRRFLAAEFDKEKCQNGIWATLEPAQRLRFRPAQNASPSLDAAMMNEMRRTPAYELRQKKYAKFKSNEEARVARIRSKRTAAADQWLGPPYPKEGPLSNGPPFAADWSEFLGSRKSWTISANDATKLLVGFLRSEGYAFGFGSTMVAVFQVRDGTVPTLVPLGPDNGAPEWHGFEALGAMSLPAGLPLLLYWSGDEMGALLPVGERYRVDERIAFGPA